MSAGGQPDSWGPRHFARGPGSVASSSQLFKASSEQALTSFRNVARLFGRILATSSLTFQPGGILLQQLFAVSHFLARTPVVNGTDTAQPDDPALGVIGAAWTQSDRSKWSADESVREGLLPQLWTLSHNVTAVDS